MKQKKRGFIKGTTGAAELLGISTRTVTRKIQAGTFPTPYTSRTLANGHTRYIWKKKDLIAYATREKMSVDFDQNPL